MFNNKIKTKIPVINGIIELIIAGESNSIETIIEREDAADHGEACVQLWEGCFYQYHISNGYFLETSEIVTRSKFNESEGRISPNIYVGTLSIDILNVKGDYCGNVKLEVQSRKTSYREDYRQMLNDITEKCTDLLLQHSSPVSQLLTIDFNTDSQTLYQRFAFIKSILESDEFRESVNKIVSAPVTKWEVSEAVKDIRAVRRVDRSGLRQFAGSSNRIPLPFEHPLKATIDSIPRNIIIDHKVESIDTPENRFVKFALISFTNFIGEIRFKSDKSSRVHKEASLLESKLQNVLSHSYFKKLSNLNSIPQNNPVLQRKEGYREVLRTWLMFDLAARLIWKGGDDVYGAGKKDVAVLYEYWLFFKLLEIIEYVFSFAHIDAEQFIKPTKDGLGLQLIQGESFAVRGLYDGGSRKLEVEFCYNRTFSGGKKYPAGGSWTKNMRPDYTLSLWPYGIDAEEAERDELITHIHFDAKYKVDYLKDIVGTEDEFETEKEDQRRGTYKRVDLLKMHTYKDAIRRTAGAYILYPGSDQSYRPKGFHELIPGLGAFSIRPTKVNDGTEDLKKFLNEVITHFMNRASQREEYKYRIYDVFKERTAITLNEKLPEPFGANRGLLPENTFVLVGYYQEIQLEWITQNNLYNTRAEKDNKLIKLNPELTGAKFLLLHTMGENVTGRFYRIVDSGPRIYSKDDLINKGYPKLPSKNFYLVYKIVPVEDIEFHGCKWDISKLDCIRNGNEKGFLPFSVNLTELMGAIVK